MQRHLKVYLCMVALLALLAACGHKTEPVKIHRFEQVLFDTPTASLQDELIKQRSLYSSPLLNVHPDDPDFMAMLTGFVEDPTMREIYRTTDSLYHDLRWLEASLGEAMSRAAALCPEVNYRRFYTLITADFEDYQSRVFCHGQDMAISIERYALGAFGKFQHFGVPAYLVNLCRSEYILPDCMAAAARAHIELPEGDLTLLDYAIAEGKTLYFIQQTLPGTADSLLLRYTGQQLAWMEENVAQVWGWLIQNQALYSSDVSKMRNLIDDAPKTNAFGEGSAPRTVAYIGWQIVKKYMKKCNATMSELFKETDSRKVLEQSGWRP